ncbi:DUF4265 domain-containing protein [Archangium lansingense]|uniref:DUF4265 domain-containing protein n=1 Tax=Archangium lansingense TaxID=2995310 RepID=A0ABT4AF21_9BACT|nr:DUF4265 domain-containing protein [Archangium lansinium]MCY1079789.1 DUF4265 domain-containing protein [Archangium lansinium]
MNERLKLRFHFENSAGENETETMWVIKRDDGYEIDNIPFYVKELALGDVVAAQSDKGGAPWYSELVRPSGHSTIHLWFSHEEDVESVRGTLRQMGCASEVSNLPRLVAVDVPPEVSYDKVKAFLEQGEQTGLFEYQEACLGFL